jgi:hypothetical protein
LLQRLDAPSQLRVLAHQATHVCITRRALLAGPLLRVRRPRSIALPFHRGVSRRGRTTLQLANAHQRVGEFAAGLGHAALHGGQTCARALATGVLEFALQPLELLPQQIHAGFQPLHLLGPTPRSARSLVVVGGRPRGRDGDDQEKRGQEGCEEATHDGLQGEDPS